MASLFTLEQLRGFVVLSLPLLFRGLVGRRRVRAFPGAGASISRVGHFSATIVPMHEELGRRHDVKLGSDRAFGFVMAAGCLLVALAPLRQGQPVRGWAIVLGVVFAGCALARPHALRPLNAWWTRFGQVLNRVISPILLALVFYVAIVPTGLLMRIAGRDPLRRKRDSKAASYWLPRTPAEPPPSMTQQF